MDLPEVEQRQGGALVSDVPDPGDHVDPGEFFYNNGAGAASYPFSLKVLQGYTGSAVCAEGAVLGFGFYAIGATSFTPFVYSGDNAGGKSASYSVYITGTWK